MRRISRALFLLVLLACPVATIMAQVRPLGPDSSRMPSGSEKIGYSVLRVYEPGGGPHAAGSNGKTNGIDTARVRSLVRDGEVIDSPVQYEKLFGTPAANVDWTTMRVYVVEEMTVYKLGRLESRTVLSGVYRSGDELRVGQTSTRYGPCQGIAQQPEWFTYQRRFLLLLIPRTPEKIVRFHTLVGGCPPNIP